MLIPMVVAAVGLGMVCHLDTGVPGRRIYDDEDISKSKFFISKEFSKTQYRSIESSSDISDFLSVSGDLSLKVKSGGDDKSKSFNLQGLGEYLTKTVDRENSVEIMVQVYHETGAMTFPSYLPPKTDWQTMAQKRVGTYYIRSVIYGGRLILYFRFTALKKENMEEIKAAVKANLQFSGSFDVSASGKLEKLNKELSGKAKLTIDAFATTPFGSPPTTLESAFKIITAYPELIKKLNDGKGAPLLLELVPLNTLQKNYTESKVDAYLNGVLSSAIDKYDDLRYADGALSPIVNNGSISDKEAELAEDLDDKLKKAKRAMEIAIKRFDPAKGPKQFEDAFKRYGEGVDNVPNKYTRQVMYLAHKINNTEFNWFPYTTAVTNYVRWGNTTCSLPSTEPLYVGYAASTNGFGNGGDHLCLPSHDASLQAKEIKDKTSLSHISGVGYKFPEKTGQIFCAYCILQNATTTFVVTGLTSCPSDSKLEYKGYLMLNRQTAATSSPICLDKNPVEKLPGIEQLKVDNFVSTLIPALVDCPDCRDSKERFLPCVVCSR